MADPSLSSTAKLVADVLLITFRNTQTGQCNPSFQTIADAIGRSRRTVITAIKELNAGSDPWLIVRSTGGGSKSHTNNYEFRLKGTGVIHCTGEEDCTGAENVRTGETDCTAGVKETAHELSSELPRTIVAHHAETVGPDRSLPRSLTGALRDPERRERKEVVQNRIAERVGGWEVLMEFPHTELERLTELESARRLTDDVLQSAILGLGLSARTGPV